MDAFLKNVKALLDDFKITQGKFAESIGVSNITVNGWLNRNVQPQRHNLDSICEAFGVSHNDLLSDTSGYYAKFHGLTSAPFGAVGVNTSSSRFVPIRVLGAAHAGELDEAWEYESEAILYEEIAAKHPRCYALEVNGSCMDKVFTDQDYIFIDPDMAPADGSVAVMLIDGQTQVRRYRQGNDTVTLVSESFNPQPDIVIRSGDGQEAICQGVVFWWQSKKEHD